MVFLTFRIQTTGPRARIRETQKHTYATLVGTWYVSTGKARVLVFSPPGFRDLVKESSPQLPTSLTSLHLACSPGEV